MTPQASTFPLSRAFGCTMSPFVVFCCAPSHFCFRAKQRPPIVGREPATLCPSLPPSCQHGNYLFPSSDMSAFKFSVSPVQGLGPQLAMSFVKLCAADTGMVLLLCPASQGGQLPDTAIGTPMLDLVVSLVNDSHERPTEYATGKYTAVLTQPGNVDVPLRSGPTLVGTATVAWRAQAVVAGADASGVGGIQDDEEDLPTRLTPLFEDATQTGTITMNKLLVLSDKLGLDVDQPTLETVIPAAKRGGLFFDECVDFLNKAVLLVNSRADRGDMFDIGGDDNGGGRKRGASGNVKVSPWEYLAHMCGATDDSESTNDVGANTGDTDAAGSSASNDQRALTTADTSEVSTGRYASPLGSFYFSAILFSSSPRRHSSSPTTPRTGRPSALLARSRHCRHAAR